MLYCIKEYWNVHYERCCAIYSHGVHPYTVPRICISLHNHHSALAEHPMALTKAEVIDHHPCITARCLLESWHMQRNRDTLNREKGTLPEVYTALLE